MHPAQPFLLLSGSADGLLNVYDTKLNDEEEALCQVFNHGSSIHYAGFLNKSDIFAASHNETFAVYRLSGKDGVEEEDVVTAFGDVREQLACQYIIDIMASVKGEALIAVGNHT